jgi:exosortase
MAVMKASLAAAQHEVTVDARTSVILCLAGSFSVATVWAEVIYHLQHEWSYNPQYAYAWTVPFLAAYLLRKRWVDRPQPQPRSTAAPTAVLILGSLVLVGLRFVAEANPDWRLLSWAMSSVAVAVSLAFLFYLGGKSWLRYFAFPVFFLLVAVPWPVQFEQAVIQGLMRTVTSINVFLLTVGGIPALQHGNVIELRSGYIGIEEACSGVRSLQATLMVSLFLGELYSFSTLRRLILIGAGALLAFICNLARTAALVWLGASKGAESIEAWHDPAGLTILLVCLFGLWGLSVLMCRGSLPRQDQIGAPSRSLRPLPLVLTVSILSLLVMGEVGVQAWYRFHQSAIASSRWGTQWPETEQTYKPISIPSATQAILRYDEGGGATWNGKDLHHWVMYFFRWLPGRTAALFVKVHRPDVCLPASGLTLTRDDGIQLLIINGVSLPVRSYRFDDHGVPVHVIYCYWDARSSYETVNAATEEDWTAKGRLEAALRGRREIGAQMLELVVWGYEDDDAAKMALERQLAQVIVPG